MSDTPNERSGSRWEPEPGEQTTEELAGPIEQPTEMLPGLQEEPAPAPPPKRRVPRVAAAVAIVAAATIAGGAVGMALAGNRSQQVSDTAVTSVPTTGVDEQTGQLEPGFGDRDGRGHFGHHGPGGH